MKALLVQWHIREGEKTKPGEEEGIFFNLLHKRKRKKGKERSMPPVDGEGRSIREKEERFPRGGRGRTLFSPRIYERKLGEDLFLKRGGVIALPGEADTTR